MLVPFFMAKAERGGLRSNSCSRLSLAVSGGEEGVRKEEKRRKINA